MVTFGRHRNLDVVAAAHVNTPQAASLNVGDERVYHPCMFEDEDDDRRAETAADPAARAEEKSTEFRIHAELAAVFEGPRKFEAEVHNDADEDVVRSVQRAVAKLEKSCEPNTPLIKPEFYPDAAAVLNRHREAGLSTNDYYVLPGDGQVMIVRWLTDDQVESFYERMQAHFDAAIGGYREDEEQAHAWKQDDATKAYLAALEKIAVKMADRYLRGPIKEHEIYVISTLTADEININYLCDQLLTVPASQVVGEDATPRDNASDSELAWYFKMFVLRGCEKGVEKMCVFAFLQKPDAF